MTPKPVYVVDEVGTVVAAVNTLLLPMLQAYDPNIAGINYLYDAPKALQNTIVEMTQSGNGLKYPMVALVLPVRERHGAQVGIDSLDPLRILIGRWSNPTDKTKTRYDNNFKPVLYPIYLELLHQFDVSRKFLTQGATMIQHVKTDWPYWGGDSPPEGANPFNDWLDIIEITDLQLKLNLKNC